YELQFEIRVGIEGILDALRIIDAGHLNHYLISAFAALALDRGFGNAECIDSILDDRLGLLGSLFTKLVLGGLLHRCGDGAASLVDLPIAAKIGFQLSYDVGVL